jgi:hypothetical protein
MPYAPGITYDNSGLAAGILHGSASIARGLERYQEEKARIVQNGKFAEGIFKTNPEIQKRIGMSEDEFKALAAQDKTALVGGATASIHNEVEQAKAKETQAQAALMDQHRAYYQQLNEQNTALQGFSREFAQGPQAFTMDNSAPDAPGAPPGTADLLQQYAEPTPQARMMNALQRYPGAAASPQFDNTALALQRFMTPGKVKANPALGETREIPGVGSIVGMGPENAPHFAPVQKAPKAEPDHQLYPWLLSTNEDEVRKGLGSIKDPDEFMQAIKDRTAVMRSRDKPDPMKEILNELLTKKAAESKPGFLERWFGGAKATPGAAPAPAAAQPQYRKGQRVKQGGATFEWDGNKFVPVATQ